jgi:ABC-type amino acid transport substrate-binding protein
MKIAAAAALMGMTMFATAAMAQDLPNLEGKEVVVVTENAYPPLQFLDKSGAVIPDDDLTDFENIPLGTDVRDYMAQEVLPHAPDAYVDDGFRDEYDGQVGVVGYEINFNRYFYEYQPPRDLADIDAELKAVEGEIAAILAEVTE